MNHQSRQPFGGLSNLSTWRGVVAGCCAVLSTAALAQADDRPGGAPLWELGGVALGVSQNAYPGSDQQVNRALALPYFIYRGDVFRADRETAGIRALKTETLELDLGFAGAFGSGSDTIEARQGMRKLGTLVELGPRLKWDLGAGPAGGRLSAVFPVRAVLDLSDQAATGVGALSPSSPTPGGPTAAGVTARRSAPSLPTHVWHKLSMKYAARKPPPCARRIRLKAAWCPCVWAQRFRAAWEGTGTCSALRDWTALPAQPTKAAPWYADRLARQQAWAWSTPGCGQNEPHLIEETGALPQRATRLD